MAFGSSNLFTRESLLAARKKPRIADRSQYITPPPVAAMTRTLRTSLHYPAPRRPTVSIPSRPSINIRPRPGININGGVPFGVVAASGGMPARSGTAAAAAGGGLPALSGGGGFDLGLGAIGGQIGSSVTGIMGQIRNLIPLAVKIIIAVIVVKIVLWLVRGRRR